MEPRADGLPRTPNTDSKIALQHRETIAAYDERRRLFESLRNNFLTDEERESLQRDYATAAKKFDSLRSAIVK